jgi:Raf kinase inhibitor-like YbhB/YbcL family protein
VSARRVGAALASVALLAGLAAGCGGGGGSAMSATSRPVMTPIHLSSSAFEPQGPLPRRFTCDGTGHSPPLAWSGVPSAARELALVLEDPDAPGGRFVHWTVWRLKPSLKRMSEGSVPPGAAQGRNDFGRVGYGPPCPPKGSPPHHYLFTLYALRGPLSLAPAADPSPAIGAIARDALASGSLETSYGR